MLIDKIKPTILFFVQLNFEILAVVLIFLTSVAASNPTTASDNLSEVMNLTPGNFDRELGKKPYIVMFYVPR